MILMFIISGFSFIKKLREIFFYKKDYSYILAFKAVVNYVDNLRSIDRKI